MGGHSGHMEGLNNDHIGGHIQPAPVRETKSQPSVGCEKQETKSENIEQVLRDLEELVDRDLSAKDQTDKCRTKPQASSSLPEADQMTDWPTNSIVTFPSIQLPDISDSSTSSTSWLTRTSPASLGPVSPPRPSLRSAPYKRGGSGGQAATRGGNTEVACGQCGWMFDNANFLQLHRVLMHSRRRETKVLVYMIIIYNRLLCNMYPFLKIVHDHNPYPEHDFARALPLQAVQRTSYLQSSLPHL